MSAPQGPFGHNQQSPGQQPPHSGQQPYGGQAPHPGQQPYGGQAPHPGQQPGQPMGMPDKPKRSVFQNFKAVLSGIILVIVVIVMGVTWYNGQQRDKALTVGQCVNVTGEDDDPEIESIDCDADGTKQVPMRVIEKHDGTATCSDDMLTYQEGSTRRRSGTKRINKTVCLAPVMAEGKFYAVDRSVSAGLREVGSAEEASWKISKLHDSANGSCAEGEKTISYPKWPRTYCLAQP